MKKSTLFFVSALISLFAFVNAIIFLRTDSLLPVAVVINLALITLLLLAVALIYDVKGK